MKVNILTTSVSRNAGGVLAAVRDLYKSHLMNKISLTVYGINDKFTLLDKETWQPLELKTFNSITNFNYSISLKKKLFEFNSDILHLHGLWQYPHVLANEYKMNKSSKLIITPHGMLDIYAVARRSKIKTVLANLLFANKSFQNCDCFHALCLSELNSIRSYGILKPVAIIPNGVNLPSINVDRKSQKGKKHLLYLGRIHPKKGLDLLINAFANIKQNNHHLLNYWILDIVGWSNDDFEEKMKTLVKNLNLENNIIFHGSAFGIEKEQFYIKADAYILPSHSEGLPMTVLEAWSYSLPAIITPECNIPEGFENNAAISIAPDTKNIEQALIKFFNLTNEERIKMGINGYELVKNQFTWDISAQKMTQLYDWILNGGEKPEFVYL